MDIAFSLFNAPLLSYESRVLCLLLRHTGLCSEWTMENVIFITATGLFEILFNEITRVYNIGEVHGVECWRTLKAP